MLGHVKYYRSLVSELIVDTNIVISEERTSFSRFYPQYSRTEDTRSSRSFRARSDHPSSRQSTPAQIDSEMRCNAYLRAPTSHVFLMMSPRSVLRRTNALLFQQGWGNPNRFSFIAKSTQGS